MQAVEAKIAALNQTKKAISPKESVKSELEMPVEKPKSATTSEILEYGKSIGNNNKIIP